ncbi:MAG: glycosyltransferase family 2 protein [Lachnospiraceae bacterium]|nr:glycosyltransferase family 2 protein [Lachnospiraceae bacterium]
MISVIVPVYNCEEKLNRCVESILNQSYNKLEVILVNDGSTDGSLEICNQYGKTDSRIKVVDKENAGVSAARNTGIEHAQGEYIQFVDSDDYIEKDMCKILVKAMEESAADMVLSGFCHRYLNEDIIKVPEQEINGTLNRTEFATSFLGFYQKGFLNMPWNKLYKRELVKEKFPENLSLGEDLLFNLKYLEKVEKIAIVKEPLYYYIQERGNTNLSAKKRENKLEIAEYISRETEKFYHDNLHQQGGEEIIYSRMVSEVLCDIAESVYEEDITKSKFANMVERYYSNRYLKEINENISCLPADLKILNVFFKKKRIRSLWWLCYMRKMIIGVVKGR